MVLAVKLVFASLVGSVKYSGDVVNVVQGWRVKLSRKLCEAGYARVKSDAELLYSGHSHWKRLLRLDRGLKWYRRAKYRSQ